MKANEKKLEEASRASGLSRRYWKERFYQHDQKRENKTKAFNKELKEEYTKALNRINKEIQSFYIKYAKKSGMSYAEATKTLNAKERKEFNLTLKEYIEIAKQKDLSDEYRSMIKFASIRARLTRAECLYIETLRTLELLAKNNEEGLTELLHELYSDTFYKSAYNTQKEIGQFSVVGISQYQIEAVLETPWTSDGVNFSKRIWKNKERLAKELKKEFTQAFITGDGVVEISENIAKKMNTGFNNARRLVETEMAYVCECATHQSFKDLDVEKYQIISVLDTKTSPICRRMDNKIINLSDYHIGTTAPPFHCYCRTTIAPYLEGIDRSEETRVARDKEGKVIEIPVNMSYTEWEKKFIKEGE